MISVTEANQNFSKAAKVIDEHGTAVILKNNVPRYLVIDFSKAEKEKVASNEDVFGDEEKDRRTAMNAHCKFIWLQRTEKNEESIGNLNELLRIFEETFWILKRSH